MSTDKHNLTISNGRSRRWIASSTCRRGRSPNSSTKPHIVLFFQLYLCGVSLVRGRNCGSVLYNHWKWDRTRQRSIGFGRRLCLRKSETYSSRKNGVRHIFICYTWLPASICLCDTIGRVSDSASAVFVSKCFKDSCSHLARLCTIDREAQKDSIYSNMNSRSRPDSTDLPECIQNQALPFVLPSSPDSVYLCKISSASFLKEMSTRLSHFGSCSCFSSLFHTRSVIAKGQLLSNMVAIFLYPATHQHFVLHLTRQHLMRRCPCFSKVHHSGGEFRHKDKAEIADASVVLLKLANSTLPK